MSAPWEPEVVAAVTRHMREDHADDSLLLVQALGGAPTATAAEMTGMSPEGLVFRATTPDGEREVRVGWLEVPQTRPDVRAQVVALHERARR